MLAYVCSFNQLLYASLSLAIASCFLSSTVLLRAFFISSFAASAPRVSYSFIFSSMDFCAAFASEPLPIACCASAILSSASCCLPPLKPKVYIKRGFPPSTLLSIFVTLSLTLLFETSGATSPIYGISIPKSDIVNDISLGVTSIFGS